MDTVIHCGTLIDGLGGPPQKNRVIVIRDALIVDVRSPITSNAGNVQIIDASGLTVMPGLIDCHIHLAYFRQNIEQRLVTPYSLAVAHMLKNAELTLAHGITSARDAGDTPRGVKAAIDSGLFSGPRLRIAVGMLSKVGGHGDQSMPNGVNLEMPTAERPVMVAEGADELRRAIHRLIHAGADQIKFAASGGILSLNDELDDPGYTTEEVQIIVSEAHRSNRPVMAHAISAPGIKTAVFGGVDSLEHGIFLDEESAAEMKRRGTFLVPTLSAADCLEQDLKQQPQSLPAAAARKLSNVIEAHKRSFQLALNFDLRIGMGTDAGVGPHGSNARELELMVNAGMNPMDAIVSATSAAAVCSRIDNLTGTLEAGKAADVLCIDGDPLNDIAILQNTERIRVIMKNGTVLRNTLT